MSSRGQAQLTTLGLSDDENVYEIHNIKLLNFLFQEKKKNNNIID